MSSSRAADRGRPTAAIALALAALLTGCSDNSSTSSSISTPSVTARARPPHHTRHHTTHAKARPRRRTTTTSTPTPTAQLPASTADGHTVQPQPAPGSCHAQGSPPFPLPDPRCTPGAIDPTVTQANINSTICVSGYTKTVRPPESVTEPEKLASMAAYGDGDSARDYEYDHLVSLELGGARNDPRNLWPELGASPNIKDKLEDRLHAMVCAGQITLAAAQLDIAAHWVSTYHQLIG